MKYNSKNVYTFQKYECYYKFTHERINASYHEYHTIDEWSPQQYNTGKAYFKNSKTQNSKEFSIKRKHVEHAW